MEVAMLLFIALMLVLLVVPRIYKAQQAPMRVLARTEEARRARRRR